MKSAQFPHTVPALLNLGETFDVGIDTRTGVEDADYQVPFAFTGNIDKLTYKLGPAQLTSADWKVIKQQLANAKD